jgi:hypothetical protein
MISTALRVAVIFSVALLSNGCNGNPSSSSPILVNPDPQPTKEILISYGRYDKPYQILGPINYNLKTYATPEDDIELWDQAIDFLKTESLVKYGDKVDAIVDVEIEDNSEVNSAHGLYIVQAKGVAISFNTALKPTVKNKVKYLVRYKSKAFRSKPKKSKLTKKSPVKTKVEEIEFSPSELLK